MIRNYLKIAWRNILRDKVFSTINILGLATGLAVTLSIIQYARFELSYESTHENADRIVRITMDYLDGEVITYQDAGTYGPVGPRMKADFPEVMESAFVSNISPQVFMIEGKPFKESSVFISSHSFFKVFTYTFIEGSPSEVLRNPLEVVLTESVAKKYFGNEPALHRTLRFTDQGKDYHFKVTGVVSDSPDNTHLKFNILISYPTTKTLWKYRTFNWDMNNEYTYLLLDSPSSYDTFKRKLIDFNETLWAENKIPNERIVAQPLKDIHLYSQKGWELEPPGNATTVYFLVAIAFFVVLIAWVNYINLSTAKSMERAKEVGIRKVVGSSKKQLQFQFLVEAALSNLIASAMAISLIQLGLPVFRGISGLPQSVAFISDPYFWLITTALFLISIFLSGFYPALILSSFRPSSTLKGKFSHSEKGRTLRKILVVLQFSLTIILLTGALSINEQLQFMKKKDLGMSLTNRLVIESPSKFERNNIDIFRNELQTMPEIRGISFSEAIPGSEEMMSTTNGVWPVGAAKENNYNFYIYRIDENFDKVYGMEILAGDAFQGNINNRSNIVVNEESVYLWGFPNPKDVIGLKVQLWGMERTIIGVVKNFHQISVKSPHFPMIFIYTDGINGPWWYTTLKIATEDFTSQLEEVKNTYRKAFPSSVFNYYIMDERYNIQYRSDEHFYDVFRIMTSLAIFIAALGLFGLVAFTITQRTKEIGIRKVLGASVQQILVLLSHGFLKLILLATLIATPLAYAAVHQWLMDYPYRIEIYWWIITLPVLLIFIIALISISFESVKAATRNPVEALRYE